MTSTGFDSEPHQVLVPTSAQSEHEHDVCTDSLNGECDTDNAQTLLNDKPPHENTPLNPTTRSGRQTRPTWKVRDMLPEAPSSVEGALQPEMPTAVADETRRTLPRVRLLLTETIRTAANGFGLRRLFKRRPVTQPPRQTLETVYAPTAADATAGRDRRAISDIITPYPNLTSWLINTVF